MERLTVILMPEHATGQPRRFQVRVDRLKRWAVYGGVGTLAGLALLGFVLVDYVSLRVDAVEVDVLRREAAQYRDELDQMGSTVIQLEDRLERVTELERKVRVIADLPVAAAGGAEVAPPSGQGGPEDAEEDPEPGANPGAEAPEPEPLPPVSEAAAAGPLGLDVAAVARLQTRARQLEQRATLRRSSLEDLLSGLEGKARRLASTPSIQPADGWLTSGFGYRVSPFTGRRKFHAGIDIAASFGTTVVAPARGRVVFAGRKGPLGNTVVLDHGYGIRTTYGHNSRIFVKKGEEVARGQRIAAIGNSGRSTGPHLHYGVEVKGRARNPMNYILD